MLAPMCSACVIAAAAGATGARAGLQQLRYRWMTPARLRVATVAIIAAVALGVSSVGFSGSSSAPPSRTDAAAVG